jgi:hypothetical protein
MAAIQASSSASAPSKADNETASSTSMRSKRERAAAPGLLFCTACAPLMRARIAVALASRAAARSLAALLMVTVLSASRLACSSASRLRQLGPRFSFSAPHSAMRSRQGGSVARLACRAIGRGPTEGET